MKGVSLLANILVPVFRLLLDEFLHQRATLCIIQDNHFNASALEIVLASYKRLVLTNDHSLDLIHDTGTGTHIAGTQGGIHGGTTIG
jgi:hypothetical protein